MKLVNFSWLNIDAMTAAQRLLGCELDSSLDGVRVRVKIVETEAYDQNDEASHTYHGLSNRNKIMFKAAGHLYVYFTYGRYYCCNIVCGQKGFGSGVLIRAVEPLEGLEIMEQRRGMTGINITNGPGKVCQALGIDLSMNGHNLAKVPLQLIQRPKLNNSEVVQTQRIGISKAVTELRRFYIKNNLYISRKNI